MPKVYFYWSHKSFTVQFTFTFNRNEIYESAANKSQICVYIEIVSTRI